MIDLEISDVHHQAGLGVDRGPAVRPGEHRLRPDERTEDGLQHPPLTGAVAVLDRAGESQAAAENSERTVMTWAVTGREGNSNSAW